MKSCLFYLCLRLPLTFSLISVAINMKDGQRVTMERPIYIAAPPKLPEDNPVQDNPVITDIGRRRSGANPRLARLRLAC